MTDLLTELLNAGLIDKLDGNDDRFTKMEKAAETVAQELRDKPPLLIRAILAGLDPDIPADDPALVQAEQALINEWKSMRSVHTDRPVNLLRAILLAACNLAADVGDNAAILWLTAADTLPMLRLGKEEVVVELQALKVWARRAEEKITNVKLEPDKILHFVFHELDRDDLLESVQTAVGEPSQYAAVRHADFAQNLMELLADTLDNLDSKFRESLTQSLTNQQSFFLSVQQAEQPRLNALWWSEALYSSSLTCSYRELPQTIATVVMAIDLLNEVTKPTPAGVGYLLAEAVNRLPESGFDRKLMLQDLLIALAKDHSQLPKTWLETLIPPPETGRLSLRDLVVLVLANPSTDIATAIKRTGASGEFELSLPKFAHALFRQEQAVQLAGSGL